MADTAQYAVAGETYTFFAALTPAGGGDNFQVSPTIAAGDFVISDDDGATFNNMDNLPAVVAGSTKVVKFIVSATETTAIGGGNWGVIQCVDAAGAEWQDLLIMFPVRAAEVADTADLTNLDAAVSSRSSHSAADVWTAGTRTLTAGTNLNDPTAATIADAVWDEAKAGHVAAGSFGEEVQAHALSSEVSALNDITVADILAGVVEGSLTLVQAQRIMLAVLAGISNGGGTTTVNFRDQADTKNRVQATVDEDGNRTAVTVDGT